MTENHTLSCKKKKIKKLKINKILNFKRLTRKLLDYLFLKFILVKVSYTCILIYDIGPNYHGTLYFVFLCCHLIRSNHERVGYVDFLLALQSC